MILELLSYFQVRSICGRTRPVAADVLSIPSGRTAPAVPRTGAVPADGTPPTGAPSAASRTTARIVSPTAKKIKRQVRSNGMGRFNLINFVRRDVTR